jgi:PAS domain S-box-containing protein
MPPAHTSAEILRRLRHALDSLRIEAGRPEKTMRRRAELVLAAVAAMPAAILVADDRGRYIDVNDAATRLTGYTRTRLLRMSVWDLTPVPRATLGRRLWREFVARGRMTGTYPLVHRDGHIVKTRYLAVAHVLPGIHVSALVMSKPNTRPRRR